MSTRTAMSISPTVSSIQRFSSANGSWLQDDRKGSSLLYARLRFPDCFETIIPKSFSTYRRTFLLTRVNKRATAIMPGKNKLPRLVQVACPARHGLQPLSHDRVRRKEQLGL